MPRFGCNRNRAAYVAGAVVAAGLSVVPTDAPAAVGCLALSAACVAGAVKSK